MASKDEKTKNKLQKTQEKIFEHIEFKSVLDSEYLLDAIDPEACWLNGLDPLMHAAKLGKLEWVDVLSKRFDPRAMDRMQKVWGLSASMHEYGETALMHAVKNAHADCVDALAAASDPLALRASDGRGALSIAAESSSVKMMESLWSRGWRDIIDAKGRCAAHYAARWGRLDELKWLLKKSPDPVLDSSGASPLDVACAFWQCDCALACVAVFGMPDDGMGGWGTVIRAVQVDPMYARGDPKEMVRMVEALAPRCADDGSEAAKAAAAMAAGVARMRGRQDLASWIERMEASREERRLLGSSPRSAVSSRPAAKSSL